MKEIAERAAALERDRAWDDAADAYAELFSRAVETRELEWLIDALRWQARVRGEQRRFEEAEELAELCHLVASGHRMRQGSARALNLLALFRHEQGDLDGALPHYSAALELAREIGDNQLIGFICQNLGVHANMRGDLRHARVLYLESIAATVASEDETNLTMAYNNLGMVCTDLNEWLEAEVYFDRGIDVASRRDDRAQLARLYANRAEPLLRSGEIPRARASLDEAERHGTDLGAASTLTTIACLRAAAARLEGDLADAEVHVQRALRLARDRRMPLAEAEALEELARLRYRQHRITEAYSEAVTAQELFRRIGAARDAAGLTVLLEELETVQN